MNINTDTHRITASYMINNTYQWQDLDVNGFTLDEIAADMLEFWDGQIDTVEDFTIVDRDIVEGDHVIGLNGRVRAPDLDGFPSETETDDIYVLITAEPLDNVT